MINKLTTKTQSQNLETEGAICYTARVRKQQLWSIWIILAAIKADGMCVEIYPDIDVK